LFVSATILAGGRATRMNGADKGLMPLQQKPLVQYVIERLTPQVDEIHINANREIDAYKRLKYAVLQDENADFIGPLAGFSLALKHAKHTLVLTVPCDSPLLPLNLVQRLLSGMTEAQADIAVAHSDGNVHPVFCLMKKSVLPSLQSYINSGQRKVSTWQKSLPYVEIDFSDCSDAFTNLNTVEELKTLELKLKIDN
jgi:molybdenum cofactor guanylyltransferase